VSGWEELVSIEAAIMALIKEESDTTALERRKSQYVRRIEEMAHNRDMQFPGRIQDVAMNENFLFYPEYASLRYRLYGNNVEFQQYGWTGV
jgi:hypothetical protein